MTEKIFGPSNHCLRFLFLVALFSVRAFLLHLSKRLCHVFELVPNIKTYVDRRGLLSRHRYTIMIRSHNTKAGSFSCAGEKFSTLAEAVAFVESPEGPNLEK